jgi:hypothetical protein
MGNGSVRPATCRVGCSFRTARRTPGAARLWLRITDFVPVSGGARGRPSLEPSRPQSVVMVLSGMERSDGVPWPCSKPLFAIDRHARHVMPQCGSLGWNRAPSSRPTYRYSSVSIAACINSSARRFPPEPRPRSGFPAGHQFSPAAFGGSFRRASRANRRGRRGLAGALRCEPKVPAKACRQADIYCAPPMERFAGPPCSFAKQRKEHTPWPW